MPKQTFFNLAREKQDRIIDATIDEFISNPYERTSIDRIVDKANIAKGSFYQYFANKDDLYMYCMVSLYRRFLDETLKPGSKSLSEIIRDTAIIGIDDGMRQHRQGIIELMGERQYRFLMSSTKAPKHVRINVNLQLATTWILPYCKEKLSRDERISQGIDLDFYAYLISMCEFLAIEYGNLHGLSNEEIMVCSYRYAKLILNAISHEGASHDARDSSCERHGRDEEREETM